MAIAFETLESVEVNGARLAFLDRGEGLVVVLIHGSASDARTWGAQVGPFAEGRRVIAYSRRYARPNAEIPEGADDQMLPHVDDLIALMDALEISGAHLVGHSWGGFIALLAAIRRPERVRSLVLMEPPVLSLFVSTPPRPGEILRLLATRPAMAASIIRFGATTIAPAQRAIRRGDHEAAIRAFGRGVLGPERFAALPEARMAQIRDNAAADRAQLMGAGFPPLAEAEVRGVRHPALLPRGAESPALFRRLSAHLETLLPAAEGIEIAHASHIMQEDAPDAFNKAVLAFLDRADHS